MSMKKITYFDIEEFEFSNSLILTYYILSDEYSNNGVVRFNYCKSIVEYDKFISKDTIVLTSSNPEILRRYFKSLEDVEIKNLSNFIGYLELEFHDLVQLLYGVQEYSTIEMLDVIITSEVYAKLYSDDSMILALDFDNNLLDSDFHIMSYSLVSFGSGFRRVHNGEMNIELNEKSYSKVISEVIKSIRYILAKEGAVLGNVSLLFFSTAEYKVFRSVFGSKLSNKVLILSDVLKELRCVDVSDYGSFIRYLSSRHQDLARKSAYSITNVLIECCESIGLIYKEGVLSVTNIDYKKDFSSDRLNLNTRFDSTFGVILDCEGTVNNGCTQVGGVIFCRKGIYLSKLETFSFDNLDIIEGFEQIFSSYEKQLGRYLPNRGIDILVYGRNDEKMVNASFSGKRGKQMKRKIDRYFHYLDCQSFVDDFIDASGLSVDNHKLSTIAYALGVLVVEPKHNALNDAKTLFNVLAKILIETEEFVI